VLSLSVEWNLKDETPEEKAAGSMRTLFLLNPDGEARKLALEFPRPVRIHGMGTGAGAEAAQEGKGSCFETELPPLSVIPMSIFLENTLQEGETSLDGDPAELA
jgi:hypothetical protein